VPRDAGSGWDFEDVRDHYLQLLFNVDPSELRRVDHERYLELSRAVTGEAMAEVFGEWRRAESPCGGGLVLWLADLKPGAGWGVIDHSGAPKPAYFHLQRVLAPIAVWMSDEGLNGMQVHIANDRAIPLTVKLRVSLYRDGEQRVDQASEALELSAHDTRTRDVEALLGRFVDVAWAYRFGPAGHDVVIATLEREDELGETEILSQAFRFPAGRPLRLQTVDELGLEGKLRHDAEGTPSLTLRSRRLAYGVRIHLPGFDTAEDALTLEPDVAREIALTPIGEDKDERALTGVLTALNLRGRARLAIEEQSS
jgi:beta-mannosidase